MTKKFTYNTKEFQEAIDEIREFENTHNRVYWRPMITRDGKLHIACCQWFDEFDYDQRRFLTDTKFESEKEALDWVEANFASLRPKIAMLQLLK